MEHYSIVLFIMAIMLVLSAVANRIKLPYPILLVLAGIGIGYLPGIPSITLSPEVIFLIFLPPLLYDASFNISFRELKSNWATVSSLAISLVFLTTTAIAVTTYFLIPGLNWPMAFALGAILSPPDAVAATNVTKGLGLSHRTLTILEGESLVNDASGLIAYRLAVAAIAGDGFKFFNAYGQFLIVAAGGVGVGILFGKVLIYFLKRVYGNSALAISAMVLAPFVVYLLAEELHVSGVLAVVVLGIGLSKYTSRLFPTTVKNQNKAFWEVFIFLLNGLVFILIGLQFPQVVKSIDRTEILPLIGYSFLISLIMLVIRILWIFGHNNNLEKAIARRNLFPNQRRFQFYSDEKIDWRDALVIGWAGMRGIVSLATALALPLTLADEGAFPQRNTLIFVSVVVVLITLVVQGLSLPALVRALRASEQKPA
ncbi:Na+/H+ antiporter [Larkinella insperata]|uniref:Na+/H+ antiporter n=1 Tax=Larkinella insperata TaxID=332158 RepID=A0ABW3QK97_9BACT|nr:Na+/H+ antiporter [Larkinella insperata]